MYNDVEDSVFMQGVPMDVLQCGDFSDMKEKVYVTLVNQEMERVFLPQYSYIPYLNLALVFYVRLCMDDREILWVTNDVLEAWGTDLEELYYSAMANNRRCFPAQIREGFFFCGQEFNADALIMSSYWKWEVLTNSKYSDGAVGMLYDGVLASYAGKQHSDILIVPSSRDEVILATRNDGDYIRKLRGILRDMNRIALSRDIFLSDELYIYRREDSCVHVLLEDENSDEKDFINPFIKGNKHKG